MSKCYSYCNSPLNSQSSHIYARDNYYYNYHQHRYCCNYCNSVTYVVDAPALCTHHMLGHTMICGQLCCTLPLLFPCTVHPCTVHPCTVQTNLSHTSVHLLQCTTFVPCTNVLSPTFPHTHWVSSTVYHMQCAPLVLCSPCIVCVVHSVCYIALCVLY